ncbi:MAG: 2TM domain-containing protein [Bacteroidales bacterium]|jgi:cell division protein FtsL|nr:2TM domain-containing protein [Bacteroidales bacterium]
MKENKITNQEDFNLQKEEEIVKKAKKRVRFKIHIIIYILACILMWLCWFFLFSGSIDLRQPALNTTLFITLTWCVCVVAHYLIVYKWDKTYVEKEIKYLKEQQEKKQQQIEDYSNQDKS